MNIEEGIENRVMNLNFKGKLNNGGYIMKSKKILKMYISLALSCSIVFSNTSVLVNAIESRDRKVFANIGKDKISIGNDYIKREFSIDNGKVLTNLIENNRANTTLIPGKGSEDFIINTIQPEEDTDVEVPIEVIDRTSWNATLTTSSNTEFLQENVKLLFDGDANTYIDQYTITGYPISLKVDLGEEKKVSSFSYLKRPG